MGHQNYDKNFWDARYNVKEYIYGEEPNEFLVANLNLFTKNSKILCLSEGEGRNSVYLAKHNFNVTGVDISPTAKEKALKLAAKNNIKIDYQIADLREYNLGENQWDGIVSIFAHTPSQLRLNLHKKIINALKPGGLLLLEGYHQEQLNFNTGGPKDIDMLYTKEQLQKDFSDLKIIKLQSLIRKVIEGSGHTGEASVVQFIAKK